MVSRSEADVLDLSAFMQTQKKIFATSSNVAGVKDPLSITDNFFLLKDKARGRSFGLYNDDQASFPEAVWLGVQLPKDPGSSTWNLKELKGVTPSNLTTTEKQAIRAKNANWYEEIGGVNRTQDDGVMFDNEFIDIRRGVDWLEARLEEKM